MRQREVGEGAIFIWSSYVIHGLRLLHDTSAPPLTSFPLTSLKLQYSQVLNSPCLKIFIYWLIKVINYILIWP